MTKTLSGRNVRWRRTALLALALAALPAAAAAQQAQAPAAAPPAVREPAPAATVTLDEALRMAAEHAPAVVQAGGAVSTARAAERSAFGAYLPSLSVSAGSSLSGARTFGASTTAPVEAAGAADSYRAGVSASWDVYTGGRRGAERAAAQAGTRAAEADLVSQRATLSLSVTRTFLDVLRAEDLAAVAQARIGRAQEGADAAQKRLQVGNATRSDLLRAQLELNTARGALLEAQTQRNAAREELGRLVGTDGPVAARRTEGQSGPRPLALSDEQLVATLAAQAPPVVAAQAAVRAAEAGGDAARSQYLPSLRLTTGYDWSNQDPAFSDSRGSWSVGVGLSYPLFDGFQRQEATARARAQENVAGARLADAVRGVRSQASAALGQLRLAEERISLARQARETAEEDLRVQQERYRLGSTTILELLTSQTALVEAESDVVTARHDYDLARAELEALAGRAL